MPSNTDDPYAAYNFEVRIDGRPVAGFAEVSGLSMELQTVEYQEGGVDDHVHQLPGQAAHANLVLQRGLTRETALFEWVQTVMSGTLDRRSVVLKLRRTHGGETVWGWEFTNAYPTKWSGPDLTSGGGGMAIETVELAYDRFRTLSGAPG